MPGNMLTNSKFSSRKRVFNSVVNHFGVFKKCFKKLFKTIFCQNLEFVYPLKKDKQIKKLSFFIFNLSISKFSIVLEIEKIILKLVKVLRFV